MILTLKGRIGVGLGVFVGITAAFYWGFYNPQMELVKKIRAEITQENLRVLKYKKEVNDKYHRLEEENEQMKTRLAYAKACLPTKEQVYSFLQELGLRAQIYGIDYIRIVPKKEIKESYYDRIPVEIHLYCTYHVLGMLLSDMAERQRRISFSVDSIQIKGKEKEENLKEKTNYTIEVNLVMSLYTYRETPPQPATEKGQAIKVFPGKRRKSR